MCIVVINECTRPSLPTLRRTLTISTSLRGGRLLSASRAANARNCSAVRLRLLVGTACPKMGPRACADGKRTVMLCTKFSTLLPPGQSQQFPPNKNLKRLFVRDLELPISASRIWLEKNGNWGDLLNLSMMRRCKLHSCRASESEFWIYRILNILRWSRSTVFKVRMPLSWGGGGIIFGTAAQFVPPSLYRFQC